MAVDAVDPGVEADFLGFTRCKSGCVGAARLTPELEADAARSIEDAERTSLPVGDTVFMVFVLRVEGDGAANALADGCAVGVRSLKVSIGGDALVLTGPEGFVAGIQNTDIESTCDS